MKIAIAMLMAGCAHTATLTTNEQCALNTMVLEGVTLEHGDAVARSGRSTAIAVSSSASLNCRRPNSLDEQCEIRSYLASVDLKQRANNGEIEQPDEPTLFDVRRKVRDACIASNGQQGVRITEWCFGQRDHGPACFTSVDECAKAARDTEIRTSDCLPK